MTQEELNNLHNITSCKYADDTLHKEGIAIDENPDLSVMLADAFENGYKQCFDDLSKPKFNLPSENKMTKEECNEQLSIAYNAIAQIVVNYNVPSIATKFCFLRAMSELGQMYTMPF